MNLAIIVIGDELLLGQVADTNSGFIARNIAPFGWTISGITTVSDNADAIYNAIDSAFQNADAVITTGGLGPTKDDITKTVLCRYFRCHTRFDCDVEKNIQRVFDKRGLQMNELTSNQAIVPDKCKVIQNRYGTAPIMWFEQIIGNRKKVLVSMPGVPFETEGMLPDVIGSLRNAFSPDIVTLHASYIITDITESDLSARLDNFENNLPPEIHLAYLPSPGYIRLRLDGISSVSLQNELEQEFNKACKLLEDELDDHLLFAGDATPAQIALALARKRGYKISVAESCTGGTIASRLTAEAGASDTFMGGVVCYSNDMKISALGVKAETLESDGAVSRNVVLQMSEGVRNVACTECSIATSGIAGPGGGSPEKPVGTVWIAARVGDICETQCYHFPGNRTRVIDRAATTALILLAKLLKQ